MGARYRLTRRLASGGNAEVFLGMAASDGSGAVEQPVVMKRVPLSVLEDERFGQRFLTDARSAERLQHPNLLRILEVGRGRDGQLFLVSEAVDGWSLRTVRLRARELGRVIPPDVAALIVSQVNAGLMHAYARTFEERGLPAAHRDVSDENVFVSRGGEVKLAEFGLARFVPPADPLASAVSPERFRYAAPELLTGGEATQDSDMFALGVLFHELLTGVPPWGEVATFDAWMSCVRGPATELSRLPEPLRAVVARMIEHEPLVRITPPELAQVLAPFVPTTTAALAEFLGALALLQTDLSAPNGSGSQPFELQPEADASSDPFATSGTASASASNSASASSLERFGTLGWTSADPVPHAREARVEDLLADLGGGQPAPFPGFSDAGDGDLELARTVQVEPAPLVPFDYGRHDGRAARKWVKRSVALVLVAAAVGFGGWYEWPQLSRALGNAFPEVFSGGRHLSD